MITRIGTELDLDERVLGIITRDINQLENKTNVPLYIPLLMCNIDNINMEPKISNVKTNGSTIFKNASSCKPQVATILKQQNYLPAYLEDNNSIDSLLIKKGNNYVIPKGTKVEARFVHSKLSSISFNTNLKFD